MTTLGGEQQEMLNNHNKTYMQSLHVPGQQNGKPLHLSVVLRRTEVSSIEVALAMQVCQKAVAVAMQMH